MMVLRDKGCLSIFVNFIIHLMTDSGKHNVTTAEILYLNTEKIRYIRLAYGYVRNMDDAEDIFQDCILSILNNRDKIHISDISVYFAAVIKHRCLRHLKRESKSDTFEDPILQAHIAKLSADMERPDPAAQDDMSRLMKNCRARLKDLTINVFEAKRFEGMSYREISRIFGIRESRVNLEIQRALKIFREEFKDYLPAITLLITGLLCVGGGGYSVLIGN